MPRNRFGFDFKPVNVWEGTKPSPIRKPVGKPLRDQVWITYMGNKAQGKCYCCRTRPIHITDFHVGHNRAVAKGGKNHISNLRPICGPCNRGMGTKSIEWYRKKYFAKPKIKTPKSKGKSKPKPNSNDPFGWQMTKPPKFF